MSLELVSPSTELALSLATVKAHVREIDPAHDETITAFIRAATEWLQTRTARQFVYQQFRLQMDSFCDARYVRCGAVELPRAPVRTNAPTVSYVAQGGSTYTTLSSTGYDFDASSEPARIRVKDGQAWPLTAKVPNAVRIEFVAGYGSSSDPTANVPDRAKVAICQRVSHWHRNRESVAGDLRVVPEAAESLARSLIWEPVH